MKQLSSNYFACKSKVIIIPFVLVLGLLVSTNLIYAQQTELRQEITARPLQVRIVDNSGLYQDVATPSALMSSVQYSFLCQNSTGVLGTDEQQIYVENPGAANDGWTVTIAPSDPASKWASLSTPADVYSYDDPADSGCATGQMTIDPSVGVLSTGACNSCGTNDITKGSEASYGSLGVTSITLLNAAADSSDIGDWTFNGTAIKQTIPGETPVHNDYVIEMMLTIMAS